MQIVASMDWEELFEIVHQVDFFEKLSNREIKKIVKPSSNILFYKKGETIIQEGDYETSFFILISGTVSVNKGKSALPIGRLSPGDFFGEVSFLTDTKRTATINADENVTAIRIDRVLFEKLNTKIREKIKDKIIEKLVERLDRMNRAFLKVYYL